MSFMSIEEIKHRMAREQEAFETSMNSKRQEFDYIMSCYSLALENARHIAKGRTVEEREEIAMQAQEEEVEEVEPQDFKPAENLVIEETPKERPARSGSENPSQHVNGVGPNRKKTSSTKHRPPRIVHLSEQEKSLLRSRFGRSTCDNCATGPHNCVWLFTGSLWACERCNTKKARCSTKGVGIYDRRDQWIAAIRSEGGPGGESGRAIENTASPTTSGADAYLLGDTPAATAQKRNKGTGERENSQQTALLSESPVILQKIIEMLESNNKTLERLVELGEESNQIIRVECQRKLRSELEEGVIGMSDVERSGSMQPAGLEFLGDE
ncbi:hypothetical protein FRC18_000142 [Serendipita sp. 400]|nr:hypothetical protein FRC18_000142 [Serendipita sp. 400]